LINWFCEFTHAIHWSRDKEFVGISCFANLSIILLSSSHTFYLWHDKIHVNPWQFVSSQVWIANHFWLSRSKVIRYLNILEEEKIVDIKWTSKYSLFTIVNRQLYQDTEHQTDIKWTSNEHQTDTNNNDKKKKNDKEWEEYKYNNIYIPSEIISFFDKQKENMISIASQINKDKYYIAKQSIEYEKLKKEVLAIWDPETLCPAILHFTCNDNFWKKNIWSISKLIKNNSEWVKYWIVMLEKMKQSQTWKDWKTKRRIF